jgi:Lrp/AsnC family leucine-responsive transcriptional regulator
VWDFAFFIGTKAERSVSEFHSLWGEVQRRYKDKIASSKIAIYAPIHNFNKRFFLESDRSTDVLVRIYGEGPPCSHDELDERLVEAYAPDVRQSYAALAERLAVSAETVRQRIKQLEAKRVIVGYKVNLDLPRLGFQGYRVDFRLNSVARNKELFEYIKRHKYFYQINQSIGGADFETEIVVRDLVHLLEELERTVARFSDVIAGYEYMGYSEFPKLTMVPD